MRGFECIFGFESQPAATVAHGWQPGLTGALPLLANSLQSEEASSSQRTFPRLSSQLPFLFLHDWHQSALATLKPAHVEALRGICAKQGCVGGSIQGGVEGGCARQEGHGPWVLRRNPHGAHLEAKDMVWNKGGRDSGDLGHATTSPRQTAAQILFGRFWTFLTESLITIGKPKQRHSSIALNEWIRYLSLNSFSDEAKTSYEIGAQSIHYESQSATHWAVPRESCLRAFFKSCVRSAQNLAVTRRSMADEAKKGQNSRGAPVFSRPRPPCAWGF